MRLTWLTYPGNGQGMYDVYSASHEFYNRFNTLPDTITISYNDLHLMWPHHSNSAIQILEADKEYKQYITIPGGRLEIILMNKDDEAISSTSSAVNGVSGPTSSAFILESTKLDREFEKHVLNEGKAP